LLLVGRSDELLRSKKLFLSKNIVSVYELGVQVSLRKVILVRSGDLRVKEIVVYRLYNHFVNTLLISADRLLLFNFAHWDRHWH